MKEDAVRFIRKNPSNDLVPIHPDNISNKDWVILLEAGTITGPGHEVAATVNAGAVSSRLWPYARSSRLASNPTALSCGSSVAFEAAPRVPGSSPRVGDVLKCALECPLERPLEILHIQRSYLLRHCNEAVIALDVRDFRLG